MKFINWSVQKNMMFQVGNKNGISKQAKILVCDRAIGKVIDIFLTTFLASYFYQVSEQNMVYLVIYHIVTYIVATIGAFIVSDYIKRRNKIKLYRLGIAVKAFNIFLIILLKEKIVDYVYLIGIVNGITTATIGFPFNMMESEQVESEERSKYQGYKEAAKNITGIAIPTFLGAYITFNSYQTAAILILVFSLLRFGLSLFIQNQNVQKEGIQLKEFITKMKKDNKIKKLYHIEFLKGITVYGVMELVVSLLIIYELKNDLELGVWTSIFAIITVISMFWFARYYHESRENKILKVCVLFILISFACMIFSINIYTVVLYNVVYYIFINMLLNITETRLFNYSSEDIYQDKFNTEYFIGREIYLNIGRVLGYFILLIVGMTQNMSLLKILLLLITIALIYIIRISKMLNREEINEKNNN